MELYNISVIIPVSLDSDCHVTLNSLNNIDYPRDKFEIFVIKGNRPSSQRNLAAREARGDLLMFFDDDCFFEADLFNLIVEQFQDDDLSVVGGSSLIMPNSPIIQRCFGYVVGSYLGAGPMRSRFKSVGEVRVATEKELILCNLCIRKSVFEKIGGFNEHLFPNEENELLNRLDRNNYKIIYDPNINVYRPQRESIFQFAKQYFIYLFREHYQIDT